MINLHHEIILSVFKLLSVKEVYSLSTLSITFRNVFLDNHLWEWDKKLTWLKVNQVYRFGLTPIFCITHKNEIIGLSINPKKIITEIVDSEHIKRVIHEHNLIFGTDIIFDKEIDYTELRNIMKNYWKSKTEELRVGDSFGFLCDRYYWGYVIHKLRVEI